MKIDPNEPAFPLDADKFYAGPEHSWVRGVKSSGLTIRAHFAAMAMQGIVAHNTQGLATPHVIAGWAVEQADALIEALNK